MQEQSLNQRKRQIILSISGGLGNQLWQLSYAYSVMKRYNYSSILLDYSFYRKHRNYIRKPELEAFRLTDQITRLSENVQKPLQYQLYQFLYNKYRGLNYIFRKQYLDNPFRFFRKKGYVITHNQLKYEIPRENNTLWLNGYFENYEQISEIIPEFREMISLKTKSSEFCFYSKLIAQYERPIAVSVRCGDDHVKANRMFCSEEYYRKALQHFNGQDIFLFSDVPSKASKIIGSNNHMHTVPLMTPPEQLLLMSMCHDFILSNSTFSYWGALLSSYEDKRIIYPSQWLPKQNIENAHILYGNHNEIIMI